MTTDDKSRESFEAWYTSPDPDGEDNSPSGMDECHKYWMERAWKASRKVALEDAAKALRFPPTVIRRMWSGEVVQNWIDDEFRRLLK